MNNKGQMDLGMTLAIFIGVIVGLVLLTSSFGFIGTATNTITATNVTYTSPGAGVVLDLTGQEVIGTPIVTNASDGVLVPATNYTIDEGVSTATGVKTVRYTPTAGVFATEDINISYVYGPDGYIESAGGRSVAGLIAIFGALAIGIVALFPVLKSRGVFG